MLRPFRRTNRRPWLAPPVNCSPELERLGPGSNSYRYPARSLTRLCLGLEALEARVVPTGVISTMNNDTGYVLLQNGTLYEHVGTDSSTGWYYVLNNVKQVSAGVDGYLNPTAFVLFNDGTLWEHQGLSAGTGWHYLWSGVASVTASRIAPDDAFVVFANGTAYEHLGVDSPTWYYIWNNVKAISAGRDGSGNPAAFVLFNDGTLWEHLGHSAGSGWHYVWFGVSSISASEFGPDEVFAVLNNGAAYEHFGLDSPFWYYICGNAQAISVGTDSNYFDAAFVLLNDGTLWEHTGFSAGTGWRYIWHGVSSISAAEHQQNTVYLRLADGSAYENDNGVWSFVWSSVAA